MSQSSELPIVVIACKIFQGLLESYLPDGLASQVTYLDYGLHQIPKNLKIAVQEQIDSLETPSLVVLGYGLCGNGLHGIQARSHTLLIPRTDDCIAILLGSYEAYQREFSGSPGTYYLTKGWLESGSNPLEEHNELLKKYGPEQTDWLMDTQYHHYKRLAFVAHRPEDMEQYRAQALEVAEYCERWRMEYIEILGSEAYVQQLVAVAQALEQAGQEYLVVSPGGELKQRMFLRM